MVHHVDDCVGLLYLHEPTKKHLLQKLGETI